MAAVRESSRHGHRDATMILIGYRHGLRASELCDLQWSQVELIPAFSRSSAPADHSSPWPVAPSQTGRGAWMIPLTRTVGVSTDREPFAMLLECAEALFKRMEQ